MGILRSSGPEMTFIFNFLAPLGLSDSSDSAGSGAVTGADEADGGEVVAVPRPGELILRLEGPETTFLLIPFGVVDAATGSDCRAAGAGAGAAGAAGAGAGAWAGVGAGAGGVMLRNTGPETTFFLTPSGLADACAALGAALGAALDAGAGAAAGAGAGAVILI